MSTDRAPVLKWLDSQAVRSVEIIDKFAADLKSDPMYTLSWGDSACAHAAKLQAAKLAISMIERSGLENTIEATRGDMIRRVRSLTSFSTSPMSNLVNQHYTEALANILENLESFFETEGK